MPDPKGPPVKPPTPPAGGAGAAGGIKGGLTRKVGPLPVWGWAAIAGGAFVAWTFLRGGSSGDGGAIADNALGVGMGGPSGGGGGSGGYGGSGAGGGSGGAGGVGDAIGDVVAQVPTPTVPGTAGPHGTSLTIPESGILSVGGSDLPQATQDYWASKLGNQPVGTLPDTFNPAMSLAQWLYRKAMGIEGTALTQQDLDIGLAYAQNRANTAGVSDAELRAAQESYARQLAGDFSGDPGINDPSQNAWAAAMYKLQSALGMQQGSQFSTDQLSSLNQWGGLSLENMQAWAAQGFIGPITSGDEQAFRAASGGPPSIGTGIIPAGTAVPAPSTTAAPVDYSKAISTLQGYIANLNTGTVTQADRDKIATYQARIAEYQAR